MQLDHAPGDITFAVCISLYVRWSLGLNTTRIYLKLLVQNSLEYDHRVHIMYLHLLLSSPILKPFAMSFPNVFEPPLVFPTLNRHQT